MLYKFVGGNDTTLLDVFEKAAEDGSLKFSSALTFNDPFEFKFNSLAPSRAEFDYWHAQHAPNKTREELENAWKSFSGSAANWNTCIAPRATLLGSTYVLCLARRWDSHLMWAHYASAHTGFSICYRPELIAALQSFPDYQGDGDVSYNKTVPDLRWFSAPPNKMLGPIISTKSCEWHYEKEYRVVLGGEPGDEAKYESVDPSLIAGVILGARASESLISKALALRKKRPEFTVEQVGSIGDSYKITANKVEDNRRVLSTFL